MAFHTIASWIRGMGVSGAKGLMTAIARCWSRTMVKVSDIFPLGGAIKSGVTSFTFTSIGVGDIWSFVAVAHGT